MRTSRAPLLSTSALLVAALFARVCDARGLDAAGVLDDARLYFTAPLRWDGHDWSAFGVSILAIAAAHEYDATLRAHFAPSVATDTTDPHSSRDWGPAIAIVGLTWASAVLLDDRAGHEEGKAMVEAAAFSGITTEIFKYAAGRRRPFDTTRADDWRDGGDSFPSAHASITFAIGTVLAESGNDEFRWARRALGYGLASAVAYGRVRDGAHWLSDTLAGAALGIATGRFVSQRSSERTRPLFFSVQPVDRGAMVTYTYVLH